MARPPKNVLMYCTDDTEASVRRFVIGQQCHGTHGKRYRIVSVATSDALMRTLIASPDDYFSCVLIFGTGDLAAPQLAIDLEKAIPTVYVECIRERDKPAEWLPRLAIACEAKRGPRIPRYPSRLALKMQESAA